MFPVGHDRSTAGSISVTFGWAYVEQSLARYPRGSLADWRQLVKTTLEPHFANAQPLLDGMSPTQRALKPRLERLELI